MSESPAPETDEVLTAANRLFLEHREPQKEADA